MLTTRTAVISVTFTINVLLILSNTNSLSIVDNAIAQNTDSIQYNESEHNIRFGPIILHFLIFLLLTC